MIRNFVIAVVILISVFSGVAMAQDQSTPQAKNVLGQALQSVPDAPAGTQAGYYRNGYCTTGPDDTA